MNVNLIGEQNQESEFQNVWKTKIQNMKEMCNICFRILWWQEVISMGKVKKNQKKLSPLLMYE